MALAVTDHVKVRIVSSANLVSIMRSGGLAWGLMSNLWALHRTPALWLERSPRESPNG